MLFLSEIPTLPLPCVQQRTFAGQYTNKRRGAIKGDGLFITANYWGFLRDSRLNDCTEQQNGKRRNICIGTW